jgi:hypothetical protein
MNNQIARTVVNGYVISTVKLAGAESYPDLFAGHMYETMVFSADDGKIAEWTERDCQRYGNIESALKGHEVMAAAWAVGGAVGESLQFSP